MRAYATQMDAAKRGMITPEMEAVARKEYRTPEEIRDLVAKGQVAICANRLHTCLSPNGVGSMLRTKINVNLGVSRDCKDYDIEMQKVMAAVNMGAEAIMDLSSHGNTQPFRRKLTSECPAIDVYKRQQPITREPSRTEIRASASMMWLLTPRGKPAVSTASVRGYCTPRS